MGLKTFLKYLKEQLLYFRVSLQKDDKEFREWKVEMKKRSDFSVESICQTTVYLIKDWNSCETYSYSVNRYSKDKNISYKVYDLKSAGLVEDYLKKYLIELCEKYKK